MHYGIATWLATRRLHQAKFVEPAPGISIGSYRLPSLIRTCVRPSNSVHWLLEVDIGLSRAIGCD